MYNTKGGKGLPKERQQNPEVAKYYITLINKVKKKKEMDKEEVFATHTTQKKNVQSIWSL